MGTGPVGVTILHLSDTQFGAHHRFGDGQHDSLGDRLLQALASMSDELPDIDVIVLSGDVTERGMPDEFEQAHAFLKQLCRSLSLDHSRVVVVPGNHDVNRSLCRSYFEEQAGYGDEPQPPYAKKWVPYERFLTALYGRPSTFSADQPYGLQEYIGAFPVVFAALNSTMEETHEEHYGHCGEDQLRWFADRLDDYRDSLRIGVVHHNVRGRAGLDEENLRDERSLTRILAPHLDLVLHGHMHHSGKDRLADGIDTPVLATGSAAVDRDWRPEEVPNQCQILRIEPGRLIRWALGYQPLDQRWTADPSGSADGTSWPEDIHLNRPVDDVSTMAWFPGGTDELLHRSRISDQSPTPSSEFAAKSWL